MHRLEEDSRIRSLVLQVFGDTPTDDSRYYLTSLRTSWTELSQAMTRRTMLLFLLVATYELLAHAQIAALGLGPITLSRFDFVQISIPVVFAYLVYEQFIATVKYRDFARVSEAFMQVHHSPLWHAGWGTLHMPALLSVWSVDWSGFPRRSTKLRTYFSGIVILGVWLGAIAFPLYACVRLFGLLPASDDVWIWVSLVLTIILTGVSVAYMAAEFWDF